jgi:hypothetical protein
MDHIHVKFGSKDPSKRLLQKAMNDLNEYFSVYMKISNPVIRGKWIRYDFEKSEGQLDAENVATHMLMGYLMAKGVEII